LIFPVVSSAIRLALQPRQQHPASAGDPAMCKVPACQPNKTLQFTFSAGQTDGLDAGVLLGIGAACFLTVGHESRYASVDGTNALIHCAWHCCEIVKYGSLPYMHFSQKGWGCHQRNSRTAYQQYH
jgi:hypothetical protein